MKSNQKTLGLDFSFKLNYCCLTENYIVLVSEV